MLKKLMNTKMLKNQKGLTLIELLAVIVILAIIAAIAVPAIGNIIENTRYNAAKSDAINVLNAANIYFADEGSVNNMTVTVKTLKAGGYLDNAGTFDVDVNGNDNGATVTKLAGGNKLSGTVTYTKDKTVTFTGATLSGINADKQKGSGTVNAITK